MKYQVIGEFGDGTVSIRIFDGRDIRDERITLPTPITQDDQIATAVQDLLAVGLKGEIVIADAKVSDLPGAEEIKLKPGVVDPLGIAPVEEIII